MIKLTKTPILPNYQLPNGYFCIQVIYNCPAFGSSYFCVSFSQERKSKRIERKFKTQNPCPSVPSSFYIIRMTSKPPCVIIWLAFPGGTSGCIRNRVVIEVNNLISTLNIKQLQSWKDPTHHHNPCRHHQGESMSGTSLDHGLRTHDG